MYLGVRMGKPLGWRKPLVKRKQYITFTVSCTPEEKSRVLYEAMGKGKTISRYIVEKILYNK